MTEAEVKVMCWKPRHAKACQPPSEARKRLDPVTPSLQSSGLQN